MPCKAMAHSTKLIARLLCYFVVFICNNNIKIFVFGLKKILSAENMSHDQIQPTRNFVHYLELRQVCGCAFSALFPPIIIIQI